MQRIWVPEAEADKLFEKKYKELMDSAPKNEISALDQAQDSAESALLGVESFFIGRKVRKSFGELGFFNGVVIKYRAKKKFYLIRYEDNDEEEMDESELCEHLVEEDANDVDCKVISESILPQAQCSEDEEGSDDDTSEDDSDVVVESIEDSRKRKEEAKKNRQQKLKERKGRRGARSDDSEFDPDEDDEEEEMESEDVDDDDESDEDFVARSAPKTKDRHKIVALVRKPIEPLKQISQREQVSSDDAEILSSEEDGKSAKRTANKRGGSRRNEDTKTRSKRKGSNRSSEDSDSNAGRKGRKGGAKKTRKRKISSDSEVASESGEEMDDSPSAKKGKRRNVKPTDDSDASEGSEDAEAVEGPKRKRIRKAEELSEAQKRAAKEGLEADRRRACQKDLPEQILRCLPDEITQNLQDHQREGLMFMWNNVQEQDGSAERGCILAHCMGLGKTLQVVALCQAWLQLRIEAEEARVSGAGGSLPKGKDGQRAGDEGAKSQPTVLIVGPVNTLLNWVSEFDKWLPVDSSDNENSWARRRQQRSGIRRYPAVYLLADAGSSCADQVELLTEWAETGGIVLIGYEQYRNLVGAKGKSSKVKGAKETLRRRLVDPGPDMVICDEGHVLRNAKSGLSLALGEIHTRRRVVLTGTPLQNNMREYHCMINFVRPGLLKSEREFVRDFVGPILNGQCVDSTPEDVRRMKFRISVLGKILKGVVDRKDYSVLRDYLPKKHEYVIAVRLSRLQCQLYTRYLEFIGAKEVLTVAGAVPPERASALLAKPRALVFEAFHSLARVWTHPGVLQMDRTKDVRSRGGSGGGRGRGGYTSMDDFVVSSDEDTDWSDEEEKRKRRRRQQQKKAKERKAREEAEGQAGAEDETPPAEAAAAAAILDGGREGEASWWGNLLRNVSVTAVALGTSCEPPYEEGTSGKLLFLLEVLEQAHKVGDKVLVFTQSLLMMELIERTLEGLGGWKLGATYFRLDGSTDKETRQAWIDRFTERPRARLFLISTRAGGLGVNLVAANRVVIMDASWNPSHDHQAVFRAYRFGQTKPVHIYRLVAYGTMEEKVYNRQITKQDLATRVVDKDKDEQIGRYFTDDELRRLYDFDSDSKAAEDFAEGAQPAAAAVLPPEVGEQAHSAAPAASKKTFSYLGLPTKEDPVLTGILRKFRPQWIVGYHPTDSLIDEKDARLTEEEERAAWAEYERLEEEEAAARVLAREAERRQRAATAAAAQMRRVPASGMTFSMHGAAPSMDANPAWTAYHQHAMLMQQQQQFAGGGGGGVGWPAGGGGFPGIRISAQQAEQMRMQGSSQQGFSQQQQMIMADLAQQYLRQQAIAMENARNRASAPTGGAGGAGGAGGWSAPQLAAMPTAQARPASIHQPGPNAMSAAGAAPSHALADPAQAAPRPPA
jgi:transcriptional regulator ATRX